MSVLGFRVKVCGLTRPEDAALAASLGASALGVVLWRHSPRGIPLDRAAAVLDAAPEDIVRVGVFVDPSLSDVEKAVATCNLDVVQLAGDEPTAFATEVRERTGKRVLRAIRVSGQDTLATFAKYDADAFLLDSRVGALRGGSGRVFDWRVATAAPWPAERIALAGGLRPDNVAAAIDAVRPGAVDVASGVEAAPGIKDPARLAAFLRAARSHENGKEA